MKKFLVHIGLFLSAASLIFYGLNVYQKKNRFEPPIYYDKYAELFKDASEIEANYDGIIIGNSKVAFSLMPSLLDESGIRFYNFGYGQGTNDFYETWIKYLLQRNDRNIRYCILSVDRAFFKPFHGRKFEQDAEYFSWEVLKYLLTQKELNRTGLILNSFPAFKYRKKAFDPLFEKESEVYFKLGDADRGYIPFVKPFISRNLRQRKASEFVVTDKQNRKFKNLLNKLKNDGIKPYIIMPPEYAFQKEASLNLKSYLTKLTEERGIPFFDFNDEYHNPIFDDSAYYSDHIHLNDRGSRVLSKTLSDLIINN